MTFLIGMATSFEASKTGSKINSTAVSARAAEDVATSVIPGKPTTSATDKVTGRKDSVIATEISAAVVKVAMNKRKREESTIPKVVPSSSTSSVGSSLSGNGRKKKKMKKRKKQKTKENGEGFSSRRKSPFHSGLEMDEGPFRHLKEGNAAEAIRIVSQMFPAKVLSLTKFINERKDFNAESMDAVYPDLSMLSVNTAEFKKNSNTVYIRGVVEEESKYALKNPFGESPFPMVVIPCNEHIKAMMVVLRKEINEATAALTKVKLWIQLLVPRMEDGNNFGVAVQEECSSEVSRMEEIVYNMLEVR